MTLLSRLDNAEQLNGKLMADILIKCEVALDVAFCDRITDLVRIDAWLDAAVALVERVLPSHEYTLWVDFEDRQYWAQVSGDVWDECGTDHLASSKKSLALALSAALLKALEAKEPSA